LAEPLNSERPYDQLKRHFFKNNPKSIGIAKRNATIGAIGAKAKRKRIRD
jgi:hypothetical protein